MSEEDMCNILKEYLGYHDKYTNICTSFDISAYHFEH